jgi:4-hydroxy-tetrahydrodipicolinate synthase
VTADLTSALTGISGILVTPFDDGDAIAPKRLKPIIDRAIGAGVHLLVANGNTSEFYGLAIEEAEAMAGAIVDQVAGRAPVIAGVGRSIGDACRLARAARAAGASAVMVHQPPDPFVAPRGLVAYLKRVAEAAGGLPVVIYLRNDGIGIDCIADLCAIDGVVGVKWATPNPMRLAAAMAASRPGISWVGGLAEIWAPPLYAIGARGFTSGLINVWPERSVAIHAALAGGRYDEANRLIAGMKVFEDVRAEEQNGTNVSGVKSALALQGLDCGPVRPPSAWPLTGQQTERLRLFMEQNDLIGKR